MVGGRRRLQAAGTSNVYTALAGTTDPALAAAFSSDPQGAVTLQATMQLLLAAVGIPAGSAAIGLPAVKVVAVDAATTAGATPLQLMALLSTALGPLPMPPAAPAPAPSTTANAGPAVIVAAVPSPSPTTSPSPAPTTTAAPRAANVTVGNVTRVASPVKVKSAAAALAPTWPTAALAAALSTALLVAAQLSA